ncbi:MAG: type II toxin-antitoxin system RelE/ParE family toxin [Polaromonas sp.]
MSRVLRRPQAQGDIDDIWNYIANDNITAADNWVDKLDEQFKLLALQPLMGRARDELAASIRSFPIGRYVIFYLPLANGIDVVRVLHSGRDVLALFVQG